MSAALGQPGAGDGLAGRDQGGVGGAGTLPLAGLTAGECLVLDVGGRMGGGHGGAVEEAEHGEGAEQPHRGGPGREVARVAGATATWSRVERATEATSSSHDSRSTAR
jgi:hypothetical protein